MHLFKNTLCMTVSSAMILAGCASTGSGLTTSALSSRSGAAQAETFDASTLEAGDGLVIIRYPAFIDEDAKIPFFDLYAKRTIGDKAPEDGKFLPNAEQLAAAFMLKNHYFAVSVYKALKEQLPADTVFLSPHTINYDMKTGLTSSPVLSSEAIPHAITIDFSTYTFPDSDALLKANAVTFGDLVTPLAVVRTDHRALPQTNGLLAASAPLMSTAWTDAQRNIQPIDLSAPQADIDSHILIDFLDGQRTQAIASNFRVTESVRSKVNPAKIDSLPVQRLQMDSDVVRRLARKQDGLDADPFGGVYARAFANRIIKYLNVIDIPKATAAAKQQAVASFDYDAAHLYFASASNRSVENRIDFAERLLKAERRYLAAQSEALESSMANDKFGRAIADLMSAEQDNLEQQRDLARQQNARTALAILGVIAAAGAAYGANRAGNRGNSGANTGFRLLTTAAVGLAGYGFLSSSSKKAQGKMASANFLATIAPALATSQAVTVDLVEGTEQITAANFPELREKMLRLYRTRLRSMDYSAVPCTFSSPDVTTLGTWYGPCESGQASGSGYGTIDLGEPGKIEYFGSTQGGFASGEGYLIFAEPRGKTTAYEGTFLAGRPHGAVAKTETGKEPKSGVYENGKRIGRLPSGVAVPNVLALEERAYSYGR
ncbi:MAG: hypothetical protein AAF221_05230 [Pseudomonadota bacterium]